jgi:protocatechuate 3,4-dioxygenase alpha subunit
MKLNPTASQTVGPYLHIGLTDRHSVGSIAGESTMGQRILLHCRVVDSTGQPVPDAMFELWQADAEGHYSHPDDPHPNSAFRGFGRLATDPEGACIFETIRPGRVPAPDGRLQAPHINVSVFARGLLKRLATRIYFAQEPSNETDPILSLVPKARRSTLMAQQDPHNPANWHFEVRLRGERETAFFDI